MSRPLLDKPNHLAVMAREKRAAIRRENARLRESPGVTGFYGSSDPVPVYRLNWPAPRIMA